MKGPRACKKEELSQVVELINTTFRSDEGLHPTMGQEFPLLLGEENLDNIRVISVEGQIAADVNYYPSKIYMEGTKINAASIGAVCTHEEHRGKGYSSIILDDIENRLKDANTHLLFVSGGRSLYLRRGCTFCGKFYEFKTTIHQLKSINDSDYSITLEEVSEFNALDFINIYNGDKSRFIRSYKEFNKLYGGATTIWGNFYYKTYLIKVHNKAVAYFIIRVRRNEKDELYGTMVEYSGDYSALLKGLKYAAEKNNLKEYIIHCEFRDNLSSYLLALGSNYHEINQLGTVKIIDFSDFMKALKSYFKMYLAEEELKSLSFSETSEAKIIKYQDETLELKGNEAEKLVLGDWKDIKEGKNISSEFNALLDKVFPIFLPWVGNINYQ